MKKLFLIPLLLLTAEYSFSQTQVIAGPAKHIVRGANRTTFGTSQQSVGDYLMSQNVLSDTDITGHKVVLELQIDHNGKVLEAKPFFGGLSTKADDKIAYALLQMPAWKTTITEGQVSIVYVVVRAGEKTITTELY